LVKAEQEWRYNNNNNDDNDDNDNSASASHSTPHLTGTLSARTPPSLATTSVPREQ